VDGEAVYEHLIQNGGIPLPVTDSHERWRVRFGDAVLTFYTSGTLYSTGSEDPAIREAWTFISKRVGSRFVPTQRSLLVGLDETGKGELVGHTILVGALVPRELSADLEEVVGSAETKARRSSEFWESVFMALDRLRDQGLDYIVERVPPWHIDKYNINKILDVAYQRILGIFLRDRDPGDARIVLDDYGLGPGLRRFLRALEVAGAEVVIESRADDRYIEARVASVLAKRERERQLATINRNSEYRIENLTVGAGNAGDAQTMAWLRAWKASGRPWPWFVKRSFRTVRELNGRGPVKKKSPPIREYLLSGEFFEEFDRGRISVRNLSVICPSCGTTSRMALVTLESEGQTLGRCHKCRNVIPDLGFTLRYYCGFVLPDTNIIIRGLMSRDLSHKSDEKRFFDGFTVVLSGVVRRECDASRGARTELGRLAQQAQRYVINLKEVGKGAWADTNFERDEIIVQHAIESNAILITDDGNMQAKAADQNVFTLTTRARQD
jgi:ribonuclease HII